MEKRDRTLDEVLGLKYTPEAVKSRQSHWMGIYGGYRGCFGKYTRQGIPFTECHTTKYSYDECCDECRSFTEMSRNGYINGGLQKK